MNLSRPLVPLACALLLGGGGLACRKPKAAAEKPVDITAADLLREGEILLQNGKWEEGRKVLRTIEERLPSSKDFPAAKLLIADSFFFGSTASYAEALVEYNSILTYFPRHPRRDYVLYRIALCHYAAIENAERDQAETRKALDAFNLLLREAPGCAYAVDSRAKIVQCWRRLAEAELLIGVFMVKNYSFNSAERRIKDVLETYPEYVDRERAYYYLGEALRQKSVSPEITRQFDKDYLARVGKEDLMGASREELNAYRVALTKLLKEEVEKYRLEAQGHYKKLVESYPNGEWAGKASDRLLEMGQSGRKEELDS